MNLQKEYQIIVGGEEKVDFEFANIDKIDKFVMEYEIYDRICLKYGVTPEQVAMAFEKYELE